MRITGELKGVIVFHGDAASARGFGANAEYQTQRKRDKREYLDIELYLSDYQDDPELKTSLSCGSFWLLSDRHAVTCR